MYSSIASGAALRAVPTRLVVVAGLHVAAIWVLINGLHLHALTTSLPPVSEARVLEQDPVPSERVTQENPTLQTLTEVPKIPPIIDTIPDPGTPQIIAADVALTPPAVPSPISADPIPAPVITGAAVDPRHPLTQPAYPPAAIRGNEEGALNLSILVGTDGRVRDVKVAQSSGSSRLDQAAVTEARSHWRLRPATRNGVPFEQWLTLRVVFHLENH